MIIRLAVAALVLLVLLVPLATQAQCDCEHVIETDEGIWDGDEHGLRPGERVCVRAGERPFLRLRNIRGEAGAPVEVINCGGQVVIHNEDRAYALVVENDSSFFRITGTGDAAFEYGFDISAPAREPYPGVGLWLVGRSSDYEADHLEIHHTGFAGVSAKTDPPCDGSADRDRFTQRNTHLHHLYVHDTGGEGFYIGSTQTDGQPIMCDGATEVHQVHFLEGVEIHDNLIENTGWDGMQVGMARSACRVYRNTIRHVGLAGEMYQMQGLQIGGYSACEVFANHIEDGPANGIIVLGAGDFSAHSNLIVGFLEGDGIYANLRERVPGARYHISLNTIVRVGSAVRVFGPELGESSASGNFVIDGGDGINAGGDVAWTQTGNVVVSMAEAGVVGDGDFHLLGESPARGAGETVAGIEVDLEGVPRADPPSAGAYEYREPGSDAGVAFDAGARPDASVADSGGGSDAGTTSGDGGAVDGDSGGCSIGASTNNAHWLLLGVGVLWRRRRASRTR